VRNGITDYLRPDTEWYLPMNPEFTSFADNELPEDTDFHFDPNMVTLSQMFKTKGYRTGIVGKWHLSGYDEKGTKYGPEKYGFDEVIMSERVFIGDGSYFHPYTCVDPSIEPVLGENEYLVDRMNYEAVEFIKRNKKEPFFLYLSHYAVHTTLAGKPEYVEYFLKKRGNREDLAEKTEWTKRDNPVLAAMLKSIDDGVGMIKNTLEELGLSKDTIIVFTSDNGGEARVTVNGHLRGGKSMTYEGGLRVSLVMSWPGVIPGNSVCKAPTINLDFYPTFAEIIGYKIPENHIVDGISIYPVLTGQNNGGNMQGRKFFWHYPLKKNHFLGGRSSAALRNGNWKLIEYLDNSSAELYNLENDESELNNLAEKHKDQLKKHHKELMNWVDEVDGEIPEGQGLADV